MQSSDLHYVLIFILFYFLAKAGFHVTDSIIKLYFGETDQLEITSTEILLKLAEKGHNCFKISVTSSGFYNYSNAIVLLYFVSRRFRFVI